MMQGAWQKLTVTLRGMLPRIAIVSSLFFFVIFGSMAAFIVFDRNNPPPMGLLETLSVEVVDRERKLLRAFTTETGHWRLASDLERVDEEFLKILLAYEDKRFYHHPGIDPLAVLRASWQLITNGRIVSGASTITMQLARLIEPRENRSLSAKLWQMVRAIQLEQRFTKDEILEAYLTLAPYGGNLEGIRAASLAYFAKEPGTLSLSEAALLVALPQSPVARRPDVFPDRALKARNTVLRRMVRAGVIDDSEVDRAKGRPVQDLRHPMPQLAAHLAERRRKANPEARIHSVTLRKDIQGAIGSRRPGGCQQAAARPVHRP